MQDDMPEEHSLAEMANWQALPHIRSAPFRERGRSFTPDKQIALRQHEYLETRHGDLSSVLVVVQGVMVLEMLLPDGRRQVLGFQSPGDMLCPSFNRILPGNGARAATDVVLREIRYSANSDDRGNDNSVADGLFRLTAIQFERLALHNLVLGRLKPEERVASFLLEMLLLFGRSIGRGTVFSIPIGRTDAADYLCLNADTYSRTLSRLRRDGVIRRGGIDGYLVEDITTLCACTPIATAIIDRYASEASIGFGGGPTARRHGSSG